MISAAKTRWWMFGLALGGMVSGSMLVGGARAQTPSVGVVAAAAGGWSPVPMPAAAPAVTKFFPLSEVKRGMRGVAYTVFEGVNPEPMQVEILGVLKEALGPGQDMILARLHGDKPEYTGVVAGMSGSPVYIEGRLVGALSYRIGQFSKEPIAGITPIESMLQVRDDDGAMGMKLARVSSEVEGQPEMRAMETPLVFGGFSEETVERFGDRFRAMGLTPVVGLGGADSAAVQPEPLVPGSAVSAVLVRGDLSMAGTCTVTYLDPKRLLACGHPITQYGPVDMPMTKAMVLATLASPLNAFKIINTTETVGAFTEDRASAIMGRFGVEARMIPVVVEVVPPPNMDKAAPSQTKTFHFEVLDNRQLTPSAMLVSVYQSLQTNNTAAEELSYRLTGEIDVKGLPPVRMQGLMAQNELNPATINAALLVNDRFSKVYGNALEQPVVTGLRLKVEAIPSRMTAVLESARLGRIEAHPGDEIEVEATLHPYQAEARLVRLKVKLPAELSAGPMRVVVSDGGTVDRLTTRTGADRSVGLADAVAAMNRMHANDRVYVTLLDHAAQAVLDGEALPGVPLSMANVLEPLKEAQKMQLTGESVVEAGSVDAGYAVTGYQVLNLMVK
ncbi:SpoIVB peptidase S55 domain-containing protein [Tunturiibacter lichenicola]|uniref:SpoIVB peptidase S55 domain-containing protein n=1 Tax=Tunturiibacter lichenicola TaxID=2051959 RepID=UPI0021B21984|nr:SpoIVB peptidase S55 domain-containing protein [Edaphobacter lichenicola]